MGTNLIRKNNKKKRIKKNKTPIIIKKLKLKK